MRFTTYTKFVPALADAVNLQALLDQLGDFLLQSGFAGGPGDWPGWAEPGEGNERSMNSLKEAILKALMESGQLTPDMVKFLRGETTGRPEQDRELEQQIVQMLDQIVQRLMDEGYLNTQNVPQMPEGHTLMGPGGQAAAAARDVQFNLQGHQRTDNGMSDEVVTVNAAVDHQATGHDRIVAQGFGQELSVQRDFECARHLV